MANEGDGFYALSDPTRRSIFELIASRPMCVADLAEGLPVSRPAVSQHLRILREARLVIACQQGTRRVYRLDRAGVEAMRRYLDGFWDQALESFKQVVEKETDS